MGDKMTIPGKLEIDEACNMVPGAGIEPAHPQGVRDFKSLASTYSATQALINAWQFLAYPKKY
jgi:hypothetical protein